MSEAKPPKAAAPADDDRACEKCGRFVPGKVRYDRAERRWTCDPCWFATRPEPPPTRRP